MRIGVFRLTDWQALLGTSGLKLEYGSSTIITKKLT